MGKLSNTTVTLPKLANGESFTVTNNSDVPLTIEMPPGSSFNHERQWNQDQLNKIRSRHLQDLSINRIKK